MTFVKVMHHTSSGASQNSKIKMRITLPMSSESHTVHTAHVLPPHVCMQHTSQQHKQGFFRNNDQDDAITKYSEQYMQGFFHNNDQDGAITKYSEQYMQGFFRNNDQDGAITKYSEQYMQGLFCNNDQDGAITKYSDATRGRYICMLNHRGLGICSPGKFLVIRPCKVVP